MIFDVIVWVCVGVGVGAGVVIGMSPARAETQRTHVKAIAIRNRFIGFFSLDFE
jgi:hypothetical protein